MSRRIKLLIVAALAVPWAPALWHLADAGRTNEYAGHAMFVPLFSAVIAWVQRDRLKAAAGPGHAWGFLVLAVGMALLGLGYQMKSDVLHGVALAVATAGAVLWIWGRACLRAAIFPVAFLVMMAPLPLPVVAKVTLHLQVFAASFAASAVRLVGIPVYQTGFTLELPTLKLHVAEICNGLRFLVALIVLTAAFAQVTIPSRRRRIALVLAAVPVAVVANAMRVAAIALGVEYIGPEAASGTIHNWIGKGMWALTLLPLAAAGWWLSRSPADLKRQDAGHIAARESGLA